MCVLRLVGGILGVPAFTGFDVSEGSEIGLVSSLPSRADTREERGSTSWANEVLGYRRLLTASRSRAISSVGDSAWIPGWVVANPET